MLLQIVPKRMVTDILLCKLRHFARTRTAEELQQALNDFRNRQCRKGGYVNMVNWFKN